MNVVAIVGIIIFIFPVLLLGSLFRPLSTSKRVWMRCLLFLPQIRSLFYSLIFPSNEGGRWMKRHSHKQLIRSWSHRALFFQLNRIISGKFLSFHHICNYCCYYCTKDNCVTLNIIALHSQFISCSICLVLFWSKDII